MKEKSEVVPPAHPETACSCGLEKLGGQPCSNASCLKHREPSQTPRATNAQSQITLRYAYLFLILTLNET